VEAPIAHPPPILAISNWFGELQGNLSGPIGPRRPDPTQPGAGLGLLALRRVVSVVAPPFPASIRSG